MVKKIGKALLCGVLERQVRRLRARNDFQIVAVVGSVGKTSTKLAIAHTLASSKRVQFQEGNYNDRLTVPLVLFGHTQPGLFDIAAWLRIFMKNERQLRKPYPYDIAVLELGTDGPGQIEQFAYLAPELAVITAISEEHMEYFKTLDAVAREELAVGEFSKQMLLNLDDVAPEYRPTRPFLGYGFDAAAQFQLLERAGADLRAQRVVSKLQDTEVEFETKFLGVQGAKITLAAAATGSVLGMEPAAIRKAVTTLQPAAGRMQVLSGSKESILIDDTYNASPIAVKAALDVLYGADVQQRIAILGTMNEMGNGSPQMHRDVGAYCDPGKLDLVITIGADANRYLAEAAEERGCRVERCDNPWQAGNIAKAAIQEGAAVLAKGSQNRVFAEEALVPLLANPSDREKLVRQSNYWQQRKRASFQK